LASKEHLRKGTDLSLLQLTSEELKESITKTHVPIFIIQILSQKIEEILIRLTQSKNKIIKKA
jgi:hypothetical protein